MSTSPTVPNGALYAKDVETCINCGLYTKGLVNTPMGWMHAEKDTDECARWKGLIRRGKIEMELRKLKIEKDHMERMRKKETQKKVIRKS